MANTVTILLALDLSLDDLVALLVASLSHNDPIYQALQITSMSASTIRADIRSELAYSGYGSADRWADRYPSPGDADLIRDAAERAVLRAFPDLATS